MAGTHPHGLFSWVDLSLPEPRVGRKFYSGLFGWEADDQLDDTGATIYTMFTLAGKRVAGLGSQSPGSAEAGMPAAWTSYINVDDVDAVCSLVDDNGGTLVFGPMDVLSSGRMAFVADPEGAMVGFWQPGEHGGAEVFNAPGALTWNELYTRDAGAARDFYGTILPWTFRANDRSATEYWIIDLDGKPGDDPSNGGIIEMNDEWGDLPAHWMPYFAVTDTAAVAEEAEELGGAVKVPPFETGIGVIAVVADPAGGHFSIWGAPAES